MIKVRVWLYFLMAVASVSASASDNPLYGKWMKEVNGKPAMVVTFTAKTITLSQTLESSSSDQIMPVKYKKLDKSWSIELLSDSGDVQAAMMAIFKDKKTISFGAPGSQFFDLKRVE